MELPERKRTRLKYFDYSRNGAYFITICTQKRQKILSSIKKNENTQNVGEGLAPPEMELTECGKIVEEQLLLLQERYSVVKIARYVIMPNHIHLIVHICNETGGASPSPTISDVICALKSRVSHLCKQKQVANRIFQRSFHDHIIRDSHDYDKIAKYIYENPQNWEKDCFYIEE